MLHFFRSLCGSQAAAPLHQRSERNSSVSARGRGPSRWTVQATVVNGGRRPHTSDRSAGGDGASTVRDANIRRDLCRSNGAYALPALLHTELATAGTAVGFYCSVPRTPPRSPSSLSATP